MQLFIVRHGIAIDREDPKCPPDPERFLTEEGLEKTRQAAKGIAEGLDHSHRQRIQSLHASFHRGAVTLQVEAHGDAAEDLRDAERSSDLFEKEFHVQLYFRSQNHR